MKKIRFIALFLAVLMVFGMLVACGETNNNPDPKPVKSEGTDDPTPAVENELDLFKGETFWHIGYSLFPKNRRDYTEEELEEETEAVTLSVTEQAMADRVLDMESKYGIKLVNRYDMGITPADFAMALANGEVEADMFHLEMQTGRDWFIGGAVEALEDLSKYIDLNDYERWGSKDLLMACNYKGKHWGFPWHGSAYSPCQYIMYGGLMVNLETFASFETDWTSQELVENREWTFEKFLEIIPEVSIEDFLKPVYAFEYASDLALLAVYANGGDKVIWDEAQGKYVYGLTTEPVFNAIEFAAEVAGDTDHCLMMTAVGDFLSGKAVYYTPNPNRIFGDIFGTTTAVQFLPFPYGPDVEYGSTHAVYLQYNDSVCGIFKHDKIEKSLATAKLFYELTDKLYLGENNELYQDWLFRQSFGKDEEGETTYQFSYNVYRQNGLNIHWNYCLDLGQADGAITSALNACISSTNVNARDMLGKLTAMVTEQIDENINP